MGTKDNAKTALKDLANMVGLTKDSSSTAGQTETTPSKQTAPTLQETASSETPAVILQPGTTVIAAGTKILGNLHAQGDIEIAGIAEGNIETNGNVLLCGSITGDVHCSSLQMDTARVFGNIYAKEQAIISKESILIGNINAQNCILDGKLKGQLDITEKVKITSNAVVVGDINAGAISIEDGAMLSGKILPKQKANIEAIFNKEL